MVEKLNPWRFVPPVAHTKSALKLPSGAIQKYDLKEGEQLNI